MNTQQAYNVWAATYDDVKNSTRDLEAQAIRAVIPQGRFAHIIELGCGTGKNTEWLAARAERLTAVDFSPEMLAKAQLKAPANVTFRQADITQPWGFTGESADLITCSLILEHIADLGFVFNQAAQVLAPGGRLYVGELHPFKQYQGSKARFETEAGMRELECYVHHLTDYAQAARRCGLVVEDLREWFDEEERSGSPRIVTWVFREG
ncbi:MAG: class I SAM-dependent methyltransferase [Hymenobacteraceae bacterium]|nr:class I SAM-dependent methyltransferase [Hymenobacteraceae bacterium]